MARDLNSAGGERLSALMDGEITDAAERDRALNALLARGEAGERLTEELSLYHLIGDVLRDTPGQGLPRDSFAARLAAEPTILAPAPALQSQPSTPARQRPSRWSRWSLPLAASVAGMMVVGWGVSSFMSPDAGPLPSNAGIQARLIGTGPGTVSVQQGAAVQQVQQGPAVQQVQQGPAVQQIQQMQPGQHGPTLLVAKPTVAPERPADASVSADDLDEYLWAHQRFATSVTSTGAAPWVRLVVERGPGR